MDQANTRVHRTTRRVPAEMLGVERPRLRQVPDLPHTAALGVTRRAPDNTPVITFDHCQYSVPAMLLGQSVWVGYHDGTDEIVICALDDGGPIEAARHRRTSPGAPAIDDAHFPTPTTRSPATSGSAPTPPPSTRSWRSAPGAAILLKEAAAAGTERINQKMAHAVELSDLTTGGDIDWARRHAAVHGRFATGDLDSILASKDTDTTSRRGSEDTPLTQGTSGWNLLGANAITNETIA